MIELNSVAVLSWGRLCLRDNESNGHFFTVLNALKSAEVCPQGASFLNLLLVIRGHVNGVPVSCNLTRKVSINISQPGYMFFTNTQHNLCFCVSLRREVKSVLLSKVVFYLLPC